MIRKWNWRAFLILILCVLGIIYSFLSEAPNNNHFIPQLNQVPTKISDSVSTINPNLFGLTTITPSVTVSPSPTEDILDTLPEDPNALTQIPEISITPKNSQENFTKRQPTHEPETHSAPGIAALRDIQTQNPDDSIQGPLIGLVRAVQQNSDPQPTPTITADSNGSQYNLPLVGGQARGYALLYLMHPNARQTVDAQIQNLIDANIKQVYLSVLVDGTFQKDHTYLQSILDKLNSAGKEITLVQYLASGPTMRRFKDTPIRTVFSQIDPLIFRSLTLYEPAMIKNIQDIALEAKASFEKNTSLNPNNLNFASVMLEDNLESVSYRFMRNIVSQVLGNTAGFIRSACPTDCFEGNDETSWGDPLELHKVSEFETLQSGDAYTLDGVDVTYPGDTNSGDIDIEEVRTMIQSGYTKGLRFFGLWRKGRQGLGAQEQLQHPDNRTYQVPSTGELEIERSLLREGLPAIKDE